MQDEINEKTIALYIKTGKLTAQTLQKAMKTLLAQMKKQKDKTPQGKQTLKQLMKQNAGVSNIEITEGNIKAFESTAKKYGIDFALKKDTTESPPRYLVFFKGRDADVLTAAFKEFSAKKLTQEKKPSIRKWFFKAWVAVYLVTHTFTITMAVFDMAQHVVSGAAGVIGGNTNIDVDAALSSMQAGLDAMEIPELLLLVMETSLVSLCMKIMSVLITVILYGRMIEIYLYCSVSPIPFATMTNREWGQIGKAESDQCRTSELL